MILRGIDIDDLLILTFLLEKYQITEIAHKIHITQPAVTQRLGKLRRIVGFAITIRSGRNVILTKNGLTFAIAAREALITLLRSLPDTFGNWRSNPLVNDVLSKAGDRTTNESYQS